LSKLITQKAKLLFFIKNQKDVKYEFFMNALTTKLM